MTEVGASPEAVDEPEVGEPADFLRRDAREDWDRRHRSDQGTVRRIGHGGSLALLARSRHSAARPLDSKKPGPSARASEVLPEDQTFFIVFL